ncbi:S-layer homology domain-containing protein [Paenibacillus campinasensis]|nr:S-layer homology domain-containing protein [Paenibacillus campinasensis]
MKKLIKGLLAGIIALTTVGGIPVHEVQASGGFKDVPANHWAKSAIDSAVKKGYFKGYGDGTFRPNANITRAEFAALMARVSNNESKSSQGTYPDIKGHWAESAIQQATTKGFISAADYKNGFKPGTALTRREMAKWMASGLAAKNDDFKQALSDTKDTLVPVAEYFKGGLNKADYPYVSVALGTGLMAGYPDGSFGPGKTTTRAEVAVILARYVNVQNKDPEEFQDLREMREVGLTGTNLTTATPYRYSKISGTDKLTSFDRIKDKPYKMMYNRGMMTVHRMIVVEADSTKKPKNLYGKMFIDKEFTWSIQDGAYNTFLEATVIPNDNTSLSNAAFPTSTLYNFTQGRGFESGTIIKYGLTVLPKSDNFLTTGFFKKDVPRRFWMHRYLDDNGGEMGSGNTLVMFGPPYTPQ